MNQRPPLDEFFPTLKMVESAPLELCKAAYDKLSASSPGYQMPGLYEMARELGSTRAILEVFWLGMDTEKHSREYLHDFMLCIEYNVRLAKGEPPPA